MKKQFGMRNAECGICPSPSRREGRGERKLRIPHSPFRISSSGFTYVALLAAIVIIGISMGAAGKYWQAVVAREKEEELLFRGNQYRQAIERYAGAIPGRLEYPRTLDDLLSDGRTAKGKRHLRQKYKDPITGEDFELLRDQTKGNRIIGVYSSSTKTPIKQADFPEENKEFEGKSNYSEWKFLYTAPQQGVPGLLPRVQPQPATAK